MGRAIMFPFLLKASLAMAVTNLIDGDVPAAIGLMRALNSASASLQRIEHHPDGTHTLYVPPKADILAALAKKVANADPTTQNGAFLKSLAPTDRNGEILAGWITDLDARPHFYVIVTSRKVDPNNLSAKRDVLITDPDGGIYRAQVFGPTQPTAASLNAAEDFPGAVPFEQFVNTIGRSDKARAFLKNVSYRLKGSASPVSCTSSHTQAYCDCQDPSGACGGTGACYSGCVACDCSCGTVCIDWVTCRWTGLQPCGAWINVGTADCHWCKFTHADGNDCNYAEACDIVFGLAAEPTCCYCNSPKTCGCVPCVPPNCPHFDIPSNNFGHQIAEYAALEPKQELRIG